MRAILLIGLVSSFASADVLDDYVALATGTFSSAAQAAMDERYEAVTWHVEEIWSGNHSGTRWLYVESRVDGAATPFIQRVTSLASTAEGTVQARRFRIREPERGPGGAARPADWSELAPGDLTQIQGCDMELVRAGADRFEGGTRGRRCSDRQKGAAYVISRSVVTRGHTENWERGFSDTGERVWGPAHGGYLLRRQSAAPACDRPVRMLVFGTIDSREQFAPYVKAVADSGLYPSTGGYYEAISPVLEVFEGDPPAQRAVVIARFPCAAAARAFWYSDAYQNQIRPLRDGLAKFEVLLLPSLPLPGWLDR